MKASRDIDQLLAIMAALRTPGSGCPWDLDQNFATIAPYTIEEAYEVADAIERGDMDDLQEELGDVLLQVVFHARMAEEAGEFAFGDVVEAITGKLIRRHPHVFGSARDLSPDEVKTLWDRIKAEEKIERRRRREERGLADEGRAGLLDGIARTLPALTRADKLQRKAAGVGFDWLEAREVVAKLREELDEIDAALGMADPSAVVEEIGDLIFAAVNLARHAGGDAEVALALTNAKFERRFAYIERQLASTGRTTKEASLDEMEDLWQEAKRDEKSASSD
ncbi:MULTISPECIES: nucleoside triphosphate pyrophosphohydrolase [unclassified Chelatococcus]|uniref:nucleoside triphosphate pyrophosphohydrolase n=1 Tax=unclassified Chelatococcus TaxID=2638111 RepID=UPI001BCF5A2A|nr:MULTISPECIES: nucleoside triphosphate pyrophosphohydrolase [unclassified Chelatococcus]CAH1672594.1 nucleoside triphosphate pyrophosphohydrolase [Hyphomicrobiales bacterium]MBS7738608.1 nucleoside triphosphate pyrophosphohydrolase [Chelatococcus sp. HY11]MBX3543012.1 nucleoside triphosphate pyrophosphohydrolase [Chelatococcus sp.]MCO5076862.1 nucleoside triphosphate pyrophosphohydrolase [Chelatococcus sp.]CAH1675161.1 nucleoside triphosphate pyrophosphohydrolase [Hyphomicrobiales bacterium]